MPKPIPQKPPPSYPDMEGFSQERRQLLKLLGAGALAVGALGSEALASAPAPTKLSGVATP
ncbi:twin-arginine translocation signal domain-containing protein, partial [Myxococcota bacterium]|nr:twin-arginine translocation signal domain-containing protein [Myxococcota bacterium]